MNTLSDIIRTTTGTVCKYNSNDGFGFIKISDDTSWKDAFVSHRDVEQVGVTTKKLEEGQLVEFDLHRNEKGFVAKNVKFITEEHFNNRVQVTEDERFNR